MARIPLTETEWQQTVADAAKGFGWRRAHFRNAQTRDGNHVTPVQYEGKGFPDLVLTRERVIFVELKGSTGSLRPDQREWLAALRAAGAEAYVWGPDDWDEVETTLRRRV